MAEARSRSHGRDRIALLVLMLGYAVLFAIWYPPLPGIEDEAGFVNQALLWSRGAISAEGAGFGELAAGFGNLADFIEVDGRHVPIRQPGRSLLALPFLMAGGVRGTFASGLLLHLATTALAALLLERLGHSPLWAALVLFHPTLAIYSRTIMGDEAAGTGLLLAALAVTSSSALAGIWAGLAVGLAALMRYHSGLALPLFAASFCFPPRRARPLRDALFCLLAGGALGALLVGYNLLVYHNPFESDPRSHGVFSLQYFPAQARFFATALMLIWPGMLLAPLFDRTRLRWLVRGVCAFFFAFLSAYYFHDNTDRWIETLVVGQRLFQVVLPLWIVSYACMIDDRLITPLRRRLGGRGWAVCVSLGCAMLLVGTGLMFRRHENHLNRLRAIRDTTVAVIPGGSKVIWDGPFSKLFGIPSNLPVYRWRPLLFHGAVMDKTWHIEEESGAWYLAVAPKVPGEALPAAAGLLIKQYAMDPVVSRPELNIYVAHPKNDHR
jgi:hypothetical protein